MDKKITRNEQKIIQAIVVVIFIAAFVFVAFNY